MQRKFNTIRELRDLLNRLESEGVNIDAECWGYDNGNIYANDGFESSPLAKKIHPEH